MVTKQQVRESLSISEERDLAAARDQLKQLGKGIQTLYESEKNLITPLNEGFYVCSVEVDGGFWGSGNVNIQFLTGGGTLQGSLHGGGLGVAGVYGGTAAFQIEPPSNTTFVNVNAGTAMCEINFFNGGTLIGALSATGPSIGAWSGGGNVVWR